MSDYINTFTLNAISYPKFGPRSSAWYQTRSIAGNSLKRESGEAKQEARNTTKISCEAA